VLKQRLLTALVLIPLVVWAVLGLNTEVLALILALFVVIASWEWGRLIGLNSVVTKTAYALMIVTLLLLAHLGARQLAGVGFMIFALAGAWWLVGAAWVFVYRGAKGIKARDTFIGMLVGILVLVPTWLALTRIHGFSADGPYLMLFVMVLIWAADSGAYFVGRKLGRHKLAPAVSPGKTVEGVVGGLVAAGLFSLIAAFGFELPLLGIAGFVLLSLVVVLFSIVGDLFESLVKRRVGVKDSGQLLPGHGGMLDRIDSLTAAAPIFALGLSLFGGAR
jgi:phosphatidate cytidylyltransferase